MLPWRDTTTSRTPDARKGEDREGNNLTSFFSSHSSSLHSLSEPGRWPNNVMTHSREKKTQKINLWEKLEKHHHTFCSSSYLFNDLCGHSTLVQWMLIASYYSEMLPNFILIQVSSTYYNSLVLCNQLCVCVCKCNCKLLCILLSFE